RNNKRCAQRQQPNQSDQRQRTSRFRQTLGSHSDWFSGSQTWWFNNLGQFNSSRLRIYKFFAPLTPGVEPCSKSFRLSACPFPKRHYRFISCVQTVVRDCENGGKYMGFFFIEDLDDVAIG